MASDYAKKMQEAIACLTLAAALLFFTAATWAGEPVVIVNKNNIISSIDKKELATIFLGRKILWESGERIQPGLLATDNPAIKTFLEDICYKTPRRFNAHWMKRIFSGSGVRPIQFSSTNTAVQFVLSNPEAIVVIDESYLSDKVKRLEIVD